MIQIDRTEKSEGIDLDKTDKSKEWKICHCNYFDNGFKSDSKICIGCNWRIKPFGNVAIIHVNDFTYRFFMSHMTEEDMIKFIKDFEPNDEFETTFQYERIDIVEGIDIDKINPSRECTVCHYWYFKDVRFKLESNICKKCSIGCIFSKTKRIEILDVKGVDYRCVLCGIGRNKVASILNNSVLEDKGVIILNNCVSKDERVL